MTLGFDPTRFQTEPPACYRAILAATRTGLPPAGDDELTNEVPLHQDPSVLLGARNLQANAIAHGVGIGAHDIPTISRGWSIDHPQPIKEGQVIALHFWYGERGQGAARIENIGVVTDRGWENMFTFPYDGIVIPPYQIPTAK